MPNQSLDQILQELEREGFSLCPELLTASELEKIDAFFNAHLGSFIGAKIGLKENKTRDETVRGDYTFWIDPISPPEVFVPLIKFLEDLREKLNKDFYFGLKQFECHLAFYPTGSFYQLHYDTFEQDSSRQLSFVFYLNSHWEKDWGGELVLFDKEGKILKSISPRPGSFICFLSSEFPHEVRPALFERRSFTGWMHRKIIY